MNFADLEYSEHGTFGERVVYEHVVDPRWRVTVKRSNTAEQVRFYAANFEVEDVDIRLHDAAGAVVERIAVPASEFVDIVDPNVSFARLTIETTSKR